MANPIVRLSLLLGSPGWYLVISEWVNRECMYCTTWHGTKLQTLH